MNTQDYGYLQYLFNRINHYPYSELRYFFYDKLYSRYAAKDLIARENLLRSLEEDINQAYAELSELERLIYGI